MICFYI